MDLLGWFRKGSWEIDRNWNYRCSIVNEHSWCLLNGWLPVVLFAFMITNFVWFRLETSFWKQIRRHGPNIWTLSIWMDNSVGILDCRMWDNCHQLVWQCYQILTMVASVLLQQCVGFINSSRDVTDVTCKFRICVVWVWLPSLNRYIDINTIQILVHLAPLSYEEPLRNRSERSTSAKYETRKYENTRS